jgi:hypothetical protein
MSFEHNVDDLGVNVLCYYRNVMLHSSLKAPNHRPFQLIRHQRKYFSVIIVIVLRTVGIRAVFSLEVIHVPV